MCPAEGHGHPVLSVLQGRAQGSSEPGFWLSDLAQVLTSLANGDHGPWSSDSGKGAQHRKHTQTGSETFSGLLKITAFGAEPKTVCRLDSFHHLEPGHGEEVGKHGQPCAGH